jgi:hypothetical protein
VWGYQDNGAIRGVCITQIYQHLRGKYCAVFVAVGDLMPILHDGLALIEDWARGLDCAAIEIIGRKGWLRVLPEYRERAVVLEKNLKVPNG